MLGRRNYEPVVGNHDFLTTTGGIYYYEHWVVNHQAYPHLLAPNPAQSPELARRVEQLGQEAAAEMAGSSDEVYRQWVYSLRVLRHATYLGRQQRELELARGLPETPAELASRPELQASWQQFRRDYWLRQHLSPADWNGSQLWQVVQLDAAGRLSWRHRPPLDWTIHHDAQTRTLHLSVAGLPNETHLVTAVAQVRTEAYRHQCGNWLLNLRGLEEPLPVAAQRAMLELLHRTGREADLYWQLRVAVVGAQPPPAEWQIATSAGTTWCEVREFSGELDGYEWLKSAT